MGRSFDVSTFLNKIDQLNEAWYNVVKMTSGGCFFFSDQLSFKRNHGNKVITLSIQISSVKKEHGKEQQHVVLKTNSLNKWDPCLVFNRLWDTRECELTNRPEHHQWVMLNFFPYAKRMYLHSFANCHLKRLWYLNHLKHVFKQIHSN